MKIPRNLLIVTPLLLIIAVSWAVHVRTLATHHYPQIATSTTTVQAVETVPVVGEVYTNVNNERVRAGLSPLIEDSRLDASSTAKCADMRAKDYVAHIAPDGTSWESFIQAHYSHYTSAGENLGWNYTTAKDTVNAWMNSPGHRANILNAKFTEVGYAICNVDSTHHNVIVQEFAQE